MFVLYVLATCLLAIITHYIIKQRKFNKKLDAFKCPNPLPIIGNALDFTPTTNVLPTLLRYHKEHGGQVLVRIGPMKKLLLITDCDLIEFILTSNKLIDKGEDYRYFKSWLAEGLFTATSEPWKKQRKMITPAFHFKILEMMVQQFPKSNKVLIEKINKLCNSGNKIVDVFPLVTLCALDTIYETAMGIPINAQESKDNPYVEAIETILEVIMRRQITPLKQIDFFYQFSKDFTKENKALKVLHKTTNDVIKQRREELANHTKKDTRSNDMGIKEKKAFLDLLLGYEIDGKPLTDTQIRQEVDTIMFAGHDTTSTAISFALYSLSRNPDVQAKVLEEIHDVLGKDNDNPTYNELQEMKYLEMVIKETMRLYPSAYMFGRCIHEDIEFKGIVYPKGLMLMCSAAAVHRDPNIYADPDKFDPERFTPENQSKRNPYSYIPFSAGYRNCVGQKFAMFSMKAMLASIVNHFELLPAKPDIVLVAEIILKSKTGAHVEFKKRV